MENRFKLKLSRMFRGSFGSCSSRNLSDVVEKNAFAPDNDQSFHMIDEPIPPKTRPFSSICRPKCSEPNESIDNSCIISTMNVLLPRPKVSERCSPFVKADYDGRTCRPASSIFPLNPFYQLRDSNYRQRKKKTAKNKSKKKTTHFKSCKNREFFPFSSSSQDSSNLGGWWFSSEDEDEREDETDTLFTSRSISSDSSEPHRRHRCSRRKGNRQVRRTRASSEVGLMPLQGKVKGSFAVVKKSSDPHSDFRTSMVEMIVEKQIFSAQDLEQLLQCFLSLNSHRHHKVIVEVFTEIWEALFSNWGS